MESATALDADQRKATVPSVTATITGVGAPERPGVACTLDNPQAVTTATLSSNRPSGRARSGTQRKRTLLPNPRRTAANNPLHSGN